MGTVNVTNGGTEITGVKSVTGGPSGPNSRVVFSPYGPLPSGATVDLDVDGVTAADGTPMAAPFHSDFATVAAASPPVILSVSPADGATDVPVSGTEIIFDFDQAIDPASVT